MQVFFEEIQDKVNDLIVDEFISNSVKIDYSAANSLYKKNKLAVDIRAIPANFWINENMLIVKKNLSGKLNYYGGFEYVDKEFVTEAGSYVIYSAEADRVSELITCFFECEVTTPSKDTSEEDTD